jgi:hypothetical protein
VFTARGNIETKKKRNARANPLLVIRSRNFFPVPSQHKENSHFTITTTTTRRKILTLHYRHHFSPVAKPQDIVVQLYSNGITNRANRKSGWLVLGMSPGQPIRKEPQPHGLRPPAPPELTFTPDKTEITSRKGRERLFSAPQGDFFGFLR